MEILRAKGGEIVASQDAFETIYDEMTQQCKYVGDNDPLLYGGIHVLGVTVYWSRKSFPKVMQDYDLWRGRATIGATSETA